MSGKVAIVSLCAFVLGSPATRAQELPQRSIFEVSSEVPAAAGDAVGALLREQGCGQAYCELLFVNLCNRWTPDQCLYSDGDQVTLRRSAEGGLGSVWSGLIENEELGEVVLFNRSHPSRSLYAGDDRIALGIAADTGWQRHVWRVEKIADSGYIRLESVLQPRQYLNIEHGSLGISPVQEGWWSAQWKIERTRAARRTAWTPFTSEEDATSKAVCDDGLVKGIRCRGRYCDDVAVECEEGWPTTPDLLDVMQHKGELAEVNGAPFWLSKFSEEEKEALCPDQSFVSGLACSGRYCDSISLRCVRQDQIRAGQCRWTDPVSDEDGGVLQFGSEFMRGMRCIGSYCDQKQAYVCSDGAARMSDAERKQALESLRQRLEAIVADPAARERERR